MGIFQSPDHDFDLNGAWLSPVERLLREQEAGGSNPLAPTNKNNRLRHFGVACFFYISRIVHGFLTSVYFTVSRCVS